MREKLNRRKLRERREGKKMDGKNIQILTEGKKGNEDAG
jgi:hypothetical protein